VVLKLGAPQVELEKMLTAPLEETKCEGLIEYAGRLCWDTIDKIDTNPSRIQDWIKMGHESVIEHASATFYIRASRVFTNAGSRACNDRDSFIQIHICVISIQMNQSFCYSITSIQKQIRIGY